VRRILSYQIDVATKKRFERFHKTEVTGEIVGSCPAVEQHEEIDIARFIAEVSTHRGAEHTKAQDLKALA
jgi:hypothetical protein